MKIILTCPHCSETSEKLKSGKTFCFNCGHRADVPKVDCDCRICRAKICAGPARKRAVA